MNFRTLLLDLSIKARVTLADLTVLSASNDPFRVANLTNHKNGEWLKKQMADLGLLGRPIHNRGLHYALVSRGNILRPDRSAYINDLDCWEWLEKTSKSARWLGYIRFDNIVDARNTEPICREIPPDFEPSYDLEFDDMPTDVRPQIEVDGFNACQNYRLVLWGEKTSLETVLRPLADEFDADLYLPSGECSDSQLYTMARTGALDGREMIVFVFADCDPAGYQMAVSIAHKLRALKEGGWFPSLEFQVHAPALTVEQVQRFGLPSTPLKETEKRADGWRQRYGVEQTEIDALATLRPDLLEQIVRDAVAPFFDPTLNPRVTAARSDFKDRVEDQLDQVLASNPEYVELRDQADEALERARLATRRMREIADAVELDMVEAPDIQPVVDDAPAPLVSSETPLLDHIRVLRKRKDYSCGG